jgi:hypothetical protein
MLSTLGFDIRQGQGSQSHDKDRRHHRLSANADFQQIGGSESRRLFVADADLNVQPRRETEEDVVANKRAPPDRDAAVFWLAALLHTGLAGKPARADGQTLKR